MRIESYLVCRKRGKGLAKKDVCVGTKRLTRPPTPPDTPTQAPEAPQARVFEWATICSWPYAHAPSCVACTGCVRRPRKPPHWCGSPRVATSAILRRAFSRTPCSMHTERSKQRAPLALSYRSTSSTSRPCKGQRPLAVYCNRGRDRSELEAGLTRDPLQRQRLPSSRSIVSPPI